MRKAGDDAVVHELAPALAYLAELAARLDDADGVTRSRARLADLAARTDLTPEDRAVVQRAVEETEALPPVAE